MWPSCNANRRRKLRGRIEDRTCQMSYALWMLSVSLDALLSQLHRVNIRVSCFIYELCQCGSLLRRPFLLEVYCQYVWCFARLFLCLDSVRIEFKTKFNSRKSEAFVVFGLKERNPRVTAPCRNGDRLLSDALEAKFSGFYTDAVNCTGYIAPLHLNKLAQNICGSMQTEAKPAARIQPVAVPLLFSAPQLPGLLWDRLQTRPCERRESRHGPTC
jgi:hypothetical protein